MLTRYAVRCRAPLWARGGQAQTLLGYFLPVTGEALDPALPDVERHEILLDGEDRVVVFERAGVAVGALLVDWKTDRVDAASAQIHAQRYRGQLEAYRNAVARIEGLALESVQACVLFSRVGIRVTLSV